MFVNNNIFEHILIVLLYFGWVTRGIVVMIDFMHII